MVNVWFLLFEFNEWREVKVLLVIFCIGNEFVFVNLLSIGIVSGFGVIGGCSFDGGLDREVDDFWSLLKNFLNFLVSFLVLVLLLFGFKFWEE